MTRLVIFVVFVCLTISLMFFQKNKDLPISNERFDYSKEVKAKEDKEKFLAEIEAAKHKVKVVEEVEEKKMPEIVLDTPELQNGAKVYAKRCVTCHGKHGEGKKSQKAPKIAGQFKDYLEAQILAIQSGERDNKTMMNQIQKLTAADISDVSEYLAKYPWKF